MRLFGWTADGSGCGEFRIYSVFRQLAAHGHQWDAVCQLDQSRSRIVEFPPSLRTADIVVGQRIVLPRLLPVWERLGDFGARRVFEIDDDLWHVTADNSVYGLYARPEVQATLRRAVRTADLITVSTEPLAATVAAECDVDPARIVVLPNLVDPAMFDVPRPARPDRRRPVVGWAGGNSHELDVAEVASYLRRFLDRNDAELHLIGPDYRRLIRRDRVRHSGWQPRVSDYWAAVDFDVAVCPLRHSLFNMSKSGCKALEAMALGIPVVASDEAPYRDVIVDGVTGFLVRSGHEWVARLRDLVADAGLRTRMGSAAREHVRERWNMATGWPRWENTYRQLLDADAVAA